MSSGNFFNFASEGSPKIVLKRAKGHAGEWTCYIQGIVTNCDVSKETKADDGDSKEDKEGDKEGEGEETGSPEAKEKDMRRLPPQKEKCGSPRVTLRIHQLKEKRDKKNSVDHEPYNGNMESGKSAEEAGGNGKESSNVEETPGGGGGGRSSPSDKEAAAPGADGGGAGAEPPVEKTSSEGGSVAGVKRTHSTEDEASSTAGDDGKKRRRKEDKGKTGSNSGGSPKSLVGIESEGEDAKSVESPGPKVPPLKIVISGASLEEPGSGGRNGKNGSGRHHLPYVVSAPPETPETATPAPQVTPAPDETKEERGAGSGEEGSGSSGSGSGPATGPMTGGVGGRAHQRVLRSHRGKKGSGEGRSKDKDKDKDSNSNSGSATSSPAGMGEATSPRQVSPTPGAGSEIASEGEEKPVVGMGTMYFVRGEKESTSGRDSDLEKTATPPPPPPQELHPRKRKIRPREQPPPSNGTNGTHVAPAVTTNGTSSSSSNSSIGSSGPGSDSGADASLGGAIGTSAALESISNSYQLFLNIRKQIERKRKGLFPVQPKPPQGFKDYLMNRCTYVLANNNSNRVPPPSNKPPQDLHVGIKELYLQQEKERHRLLMQHVIEKEKLVLSVEQEILRVHGRAARALANQALPFSACTILRDEEVYSAITPEQEEKDRNARSRYNGRLFLSWLQDVDDKWEKIKEAMLLRHHNEAESLHAVQKMDWEWKMKELAICEMKSSPVIDETHVPVVHVSDDFDLLPA